MSGVLRQVFSGLSGYLSAKSRLTSPPTPASGELHDIPLKDTSGPMENFPLERLLFAVEGMSDGLYWGIPGGEAWWSETFRELIGYSKDELPASYESWISLLHPDDRDDVLKSLEDHLEKGGSYYIEYRLRTKNQGYRWVLDRGASQMGEDGRPTITGGSIQDVTESREAEQGLRLYAQIMENMAEGVILTRMADEVIVYTNSRFEKVYGYGPGELIGQPVAILNASSQQDPEEIANDIIQSVKDHGSWSGEVHNVKKDGLEFWSWASVTVFEHREYGTVLLAVQEDITERVRAIEDLRQSEVRLQNILDSMNAFVGLCTIEGVLIDVNRAPLEAAGLAREDVIGKPFWETYWWSYSEEVQEQLRDALRRAAEGETVRYDVPVRVAESEGGEPELITIDVTFGPLRDTIGKVTQLIGSGVDVTDRVRAEEERVRLEEQMQQTQKLESLGVLAGGIAHDFNNLLAAILGNADLALKELSPTSHARSYVNDIIASSERAADLSRQMLAYSGRGTFVLEPLNFNAIVQEMGQLLKPSIGKKVSLEYDLMRDLPQVEGDATQISQIVMNLVINASEAIGEDPGTISISTGVRDCESDFLASTWLDDSLSSGEYVYFEFTDTGCGMNSEDLEKIFDPFFTTKFAGRGLGLAAVLGIVRGHRGAIDVESMPGEGTRFTVFLPSLGTSKTLVDTKLSESPSTQQQGTVLLVDDEPFVRKTTSSMLRKAGYSVLTAADGHEALKVYKEHSSSIICVLLDLTMPRMDGEETFDELRQLGCYVPILLCSGFDSEETAERFNGKDVAGFLHKPYRMKELLGKLSAALDT